MRVVWRMARAKADEGVPSMQVSEVITCRPEDTVREDSLIKRLRWHFRVGALLMLINNDRPLLAGAGSATGIP